MRYRNKHPFRAALVLSTLVSTLCLSTQSLAAAIPSGPAVIDAGPVAITPTAGVEIEHRDNIYLQQNDTTDSWLYLARPALNAALQDRDNLYQLDYKGEDGW